MGGSRNLCVCKSQSGSCSMLIKRGVDVLIEIGTLFAQQKKCGKCQRLTTKSKITIHINETRPEDSTLESDKPFNVNDDE